VSNHVEPAYLLTYRKHPCNGGQDVYLSRKSLFTVLLIVTGLLNGRAWAQQLAPNQTNGLATID
jgi:hypothetical protein